MDYQKRQMLQAYQKDIVRDLDVKDIMDELFTKGVITVDTYDYMVSNMADRSEKARFLLETLSKEGTNNAFEGFVDSLIKDYRWLWEKFSIPDISHIDPILNESVEDSLSRGDVPRLPEHYIPRTQQESDLAYRLTQLKRHSTLVLHGMAGSGKTSVAIATLRNNAQLVMDYFGTYVFWLHLGNCRTEDDVIIQQLKLYRRASSTFTYGSALLSASVSMSSISSNLDSHSVLSADQTWQDYRDNLKNIFAENSIKEGLLVLDDANDRLAAEAFDIGCKILITTRDTSIVASLKPEIFKIENSFKESETLALFASCLDTEVSLLPNQARKLHEICKGGLIQISLLAALMAENKELLRDDKRHWNYYIDSLIKKDIFRLVQRRDQVDPTLPVKMCINSLPSHILLLFKKLAVLPDNVKISDKVLCTLWGEGEVNSIMKQLRSKCLIIEHYVREERNYLYEVHELILTVLRSYYNADEMRKLHVDLLKQYKFLDITNTSMELVDDGYIAFYVGYHIYHTGNTNNEWSLFNKLYLNLNFIGNKIRLTGQADVISDLKKYDDKICRSELDCELLRGIETYLGAHGNDLYRYPQTDITQSILQHTSHGALYHMAYSLAKEASAKHELYFEFLHEQNVEEAVYTSIDVDEGVGAVCFLGNYVLVGTRTGNIKVYNTYTYRMVRQLVASSCAIKWLSACDVKTSRVAALDDCGDITVWTIHDPEPDEDVKEDIIEEDTEEEHDSPCCESHIKIVNKHGAHVNCRWANNTDLLIAHTIKKIIMYSSDGSIHMIFDNWESYREILCCALSNDDRAMFVGSKVKSEHFVDVYDMKSKERLITLSQGKPILQIFNVPNINTVLVLSSTDVTEHSWQSVSPMFMSSHHHGTTTQTIITASSVKEGLTFISAAVNKAGSLLFVSTNDSRVICIDLNTDSHILDLVNRRGNVISMDVSELRYDEYVSYYDVLVSGTGDEENSVKVWYLDTAYVAVASNKHRKARLTSKFDVSFHTGSHSPLTPTGRGTPTSDRSVPSTSTPQRNNSFATVTREIDKRPVKKTISLDRHSIKQLNLKGISNGEENGLQPLLAVVDDKNNVQIMRGRRVFAEIATKPEDTITAIKISPCNQYVFIGLKSGTVKKFLMRTKEIIVLMDINSPVQCIKFLTPQLLLVSGKNRCLMACRISYAGEWSLKMMLQGNTHLGSQEILNDIIGASKKLKADTLSNSSEGSSSSPRSRVFTASGRSPCKSSTLVGAYWVEDEALSHRGFLTVEDNATVKLWDETLKMTSVLWGRQVEFSVSCAAFYKRMLVLCDEFGKFQTFQLREKGDGLLELRTIQEYKLDKKITCCDVTRDGHFLAIGLDDGTIALWNVQAKYQICLLKHHKTAVQTCTFSPVPGNMISNGSNSIPHSPLITNSPFLYPTSPDSSLDASDVTPLVLMSMATEIVWWNISHVIKVKQKQNKPRLSKNFLTPIQSPDSSRLSALNMEDLHINHTKHFFGDEPIMEETWETLWKGKRSKRISKRRDILACIKLSGVTARRLLSDDKLSCFVTVDSSATIHIMHLMRSY